MGETARKTILTIGHSNHAMPAFLNLLQANEVDAVVDTRSAAGFSSGQYLVWNLAGHVIVRFTNTNPASNAVMGGLFFQ